MEPATATSAHDGAVLRMVANGTHCRLPMRGYNRLIKILEGPLAQVGW
jgi:hypothetical protein